jgi:hypothetical protein
MGVTREAVIRALGAVTEWDRLPHEIQEELVRRLERRCEERMDKGLSEVEALAHSLHAIKDQINSLSAPHTARPRLSPLAGRPIGASLFGLLVLGSYVALCFTAAQHWETAFHRMGLDMLPTMTDHMLSLAAWVRAFWPVPAALGVAWSVACLQILRGGWLGKSSSLLSWTVCLVFFLLSFLTSLSLALPLL